MFYKKLSLAILATLFIPLIGTAAESQAHQTCKVGAYLISLYDFDFARGTFGADLWLWSICHNKELKPLEVMDLVNANKVSTNLPATSDRGDVSRSYLKVSGTFRHQWDVRNYPFDRHVLNIVIENTAAPASDFSYEVDQEGSRPSRDIKLSGWKLTGFKIEEQTYTYDTIFGDPAMKGKNKSDYARLIISVPIVRTKLLGFVKLATGVYVAVALSLLSFLLGPYNGRRRVNILVGTLFAVLVNQRVIESEIGRSESVTVVDEIHVTAMLFIFAIAIASIYSQVLFDKARKDDAERFDKRALWFTLASFVAMNFVLIWRAATRS